MSQVIDESIVRMRFDGEQFLRGIKSAMNGIASLGSSVKSGIASIANLKNELNFGRINSSFSLDGIEKSLESLSERFSSVGIIGMTALQNLTNSAIEAGKKIAEALVITPVKSGFEEYETQINSVQTILANTESKGTTIEDVNKALDELNKYADMTIYNFTQMTRNIGTFTAAGIDLDTSVQAIKGIANLAAVSGSNSQQASTAMYQLSQALAAGSLKLQDWNSVVNAGMGGQVFQDALKETARVHGIAIDEMIKQEGSFRETLKNGWISSEILTETLAKFTGDLTAEDLKKTGYSDTQIESILKMGQTANDAATKVKTFTQLIDTLKESLQSGWTQSWEILIGDFEEAKELLTEVSDTLSALINKSSDSRNALLQSWKDLGGRNSLIEAARNSMNAVITVCGNVKKAFTDVFPPLTAEQLFKFTEKLKELSEKLKKVSEIKLTFLTEFLSAVKSALPLAGEMISKVFKATAGIGSLADAVKSIAAGAGAKARELLPKVTGFVSELADKIKKAVPGAVAILQNALSGVVNFFKEFINLGGIESVLETVGNAFRFMASAALAAVQAFSEVFSSFGISAKSVYGVAEKMRGLTASFLSSEDAGERLKGFFTSIFGFIRTLGENIGKAAIILLNAAKSVIPVLVSAFASGLQIFGSFVGIAVNLAGQVLPILISVFGTAVTVISSFAGQGLRLAGQILPAIIGAVGKAVRTVSEFIRKFIALGGLSSAAGALRNAFESVHKILGIAGKSFSQIFETSGSGVSVFVGIIEKIRKLTAAFLNSDKAAGILEAAFTAVFGAFKTGSEIVKGIADTLSQMAVSVLPVIKQLLGTLIPKSLSGNIGSISDGFNLLFEAFKHLTSYKSDFFTGLITVLSKCSAAVSSFVQQFVNAGGVTSFIEAVRGSFKGLIKIAELAGEAFNKIFSGSGINANPILRLVENFRDMTAALLTNEETADRLKRIFSGVFAVIDIGKTIVTALANAVIGLLGSFSPAGGGALEMAASLGDLMVRLDKSIKSSDIFGGVLNKISGFLAGFISFMDNAIGKIKEVYGKFKNSYGDVFGELAAKIVEAGSAVSPVLSKIGDLLMALWDCLGEFGKKALDNFNLDNLLNIFGAGTLAGIAVGVKSFVDSLTDVLGNNGILGSLTGILDGAQGCLESWQTSINVGIIKQISIAIAILAVSLIGLSLIDNDSLITAMTSVTLMMTELIGAMAIFSKMAGSANAGAMKSLPLEMIGISVAVLILAGAVGKLAALDWNGVAKGVVGIGALLTELGAFLKIMGMSQDSGNPVGFMGDQIDDAGKMGKSGLANMVGLMALAEALNILASAVTKIAALNWEGLAKGVLGIGLLLTELGLFINSTGGANKVISTSIGMIALGAAILIFSKAIESLGSMSPEQIGKGLLAMAGALVTVVTAVNLLPATTLSSGLGLAVVSAAILMLAGAVSLLGSMSLEQIGKGLLAMSVSLAVIVIALNAASGGVLGAAAILAAAAAISVLTPALIILGNLSLEQIGKSLLIIAGMFGVMAAAGLLLAPLTPVILGLGAAMLMMGAAVALLGAGTLALSAGLAALVVSADALLVSAVKSVDDLVRLVCDIIETSAPAIVRAVVAILEEIIYALGPLSVSLLDTADIIIVKLIELIDKDAPLLIDCVANIIMKILDRIADDMYLIIDCGMRIVTGLIQGIADNIDSVVKAAIDLVVNLINGIADKIDDIILAVINLVVKLIDGVADGIEACSNDLLPAIQHLVTAIIDGLINGITGAADLVVDAFKDVGNKAIDGIKDLLGIHSPSKVMAELGGYTAEGFANGISSGAGDVESSVNDLNRAVVLAAQGAMNDVSDIFSEDAEFSPTVRPVMNMDDIKKGAKETAELLSGSYTAKGSLTVNTGKPAQSARETSDAVSRFTSQRNGSPVTGTDVSNIENSSKSISDKMESMLTRFDKFTEALSNMQMVMDSGALVGQISSSLDRNLGTVASMRKRGV